MELGKVETLGSMIQSGQSEALHGRLPEVHLDRKIARDAFTKPVNFQVRAFGCSLGPDHQDKTGAACNKTLVSWS
jgi:hypothetical protein